MDNQAAELFNDKDTDAPEIVYSLENYEVARVESAVSANNPAITFNRSKVYVNAAFLKCTPDMVYALFLIDRVAKKLILRPCDKRERDAVRLRNMNEVAPKPRHILCDDFSDRLFRYMQWDRNYRYKIFGNIVISSGETLTVFDLSSAEQCAKSIKGAAITHETEFHETQNDWKISFGATIEERNSKPFIPRFDGDAIIDITEMTMQ
jgi:hypothetical protein